MSQRRCSNSRGSLAEYHDQISAVVTETYLDERELLVSEVERGARSLLDRLCLEEPLDDSERELAERLGVPLDRLYRPFVIVMGERLRHRHGALAARLRRGHRTLAVTQSDCIVGLTWDTLELPDPGLGPEVLLAIGEPAARGELRRRARGGGRARRARRAGSVWLGAWRRDDYLLEILIGRSPRLTRSTSRPGAHAPGRRGSCRARAYPADTRATAASTAPPPARRFTSTAIHWPTGCGGSRSSPALDLASPRDLARVYVAIAAEPAAS